MSEQDFVLASRRKLRFQGKQGLYGVEDLWDLNLIALDKLAQAVNKRLKEQAEESFIPAKNRPRDRSDDVLSLEILKFVIETKVNEQEASKRRAEKQQEIARLNELLLHKEEEKFKNLGEEEIRRRIAALEE